VPGQAPAHEFNDVLLSVYEAFNERDLDFVLLVMHPDVDWPNGMEGGRIRGREDLRAYWTRQWDQMDPIVHPQRFEHLPDGRIVAHVHQVVRDLEGNVIVDQIVQHIYRVQDAEIVSMEIQIPPK
jgi:nuclear transport factor 2 (NTF2) superfamily protein